MTQGPPAASARKAANSARVPAKFLLRHCVRWGRGGNARSTPTGAFGPQTPGAAPTVAAEARGAAGDSRRKPPAPLECVPPAWSSTDLAVGPGGGAAVVYLRRCGRITWACWNVRLFGEPIQLRDLAPPLTPPRSVDVTGVDRAAGGGLRARPGRESARLQRLRSRGIPSSDPRDSSASFLFFSHRCLRHACWWCCQGWWRDGRCLGSVRTL